MLGFSLPRQTSGLEVTPSGEKGPNSNGDKSIHRPQISSSLCQLVNAEFGGVVYASRVERASAALDYQI